MCTKLDAAALARSVAESVGCDRRAADAAGGGCACWKTGDKVEEAGLCFEVLHTPGHTPGSVCYLHEKTLFCGDTLVLSGIWACGFGGRQLAANGDDDVAQASAETAGRCDLLSGARHENVRSHGSGRQTRENRRIYTDDCISK